MPFGGGAQELARPGGLESLGLLDLTALLAELAVVTLLFFHLDGRVQMPSLAVVQSVEDELGMPVVTATTATTRALLLALGLRPRVTGAGRLLSR